MLKKSSELGTRIADHGHFAFPSAAWARAHLLDPDQFDVHAHHGELSNAGIVGAAAVADGRA